MNIANEWCSLHRLAQATGLSGRAVFMWQELLWENNIRFWGEKFTVEDYVLSKLCDIPRTKLAPIRKELQKAGLLRVQRGKKNCLVYQLQSAQEAFEKYKEATKNKENTTFFFFER